MCADVQCVRLKGRWGWVTDLVSSLWLARNAHSLTQSISVWNKVSLLWTGRPQLPDTWGGFNPSHSSDWMVSPSAIQSSIICQDQGDSFIWVDKKWWWFYVFSKKRGEKVFINMNLFKTIAQKYTVLHQIYSLYHSS